MKIKELRQKSPVELRKFLKEQRDRLRVLRFELSTQKVKNVRELRLHKKTIARVLTLLGQKESTPSSTSPSNV